jgi:hypothetical protein
VSCYSGGKHRECNVAAVWGQVATSVSCATLTETVSVLGVPTMTKKATKNGLWVVVIFRAEYEGGCRGKEKIRN